MCRFVGTKNPTGARIILLFVTIVGMVGCLTFGSLIVVATVSNGGSFAIGVGTIVNVSILIMLALAASMYFRKTTFKKHWRAVSIRIVRTPPGEPPEWIRRAWVGLKLPLATGESKARCVPTEGALSGEGPVFSMGYIVNGRKAVASLAAHSPEAAAWWRANAPHVVSSGYQLFFPAESCKELPC
jgi:hypothetical protein